MLATRRIPPLDHEVAAFHPSEIPHGAPEDLHDLGSSAASRIAKDDHARDLADLLRRRCRAGVYAKAQTESEHENPADSAKLTPPGNVHVCMFPPVYFWRRSVIGSPERFLPVISSPLTTRSTPPLGET